MSNLQGVHLCGVNDNLGAMMMHLVPLVFQTVSPGRETWRLHTPHQPKTGMDTWSNLNIWWRVEWLLQYADDYTYCYIINYCEYKVLVWLQVTILHTNYNTRQMGMRTCRGQWALAYILACQTYITSRLLFWNMSKTHEKFLESELYSLNWNGTNPFKNN